jgi:hypothetical protein
MPRRNFEKLITGVHRYCAELRIREASAMDFCIDAPLSILLSRKASCYENLLDLMAATESEGCLIRNMEAPADLIRAFRRMGKPACNQSMSSGWRFRSACLSEARNMGLLIYVFYFAVYLNNNLGNCFRLYLVPAGSYVSRSLAPARDEDGDGNVATSSSPDHRSPVTANRSPAPGNAVVNAMGGPETADDTLGKVGLAAQAPHVAPPQRASRPEARDERWDDL